MIAKPTGLRGVWMYEPRHWRDERGIIVQVFNQAALDPGVHMLDCPRDWIQENVAISDECVLRGIHGYNDLWRLCYSVYGEIYFVVVNCREGDAEFGKWQSWTLNGPSWGLILVPPGFGTACLTRSRISIFS